MALQVNRDIRRITIVGGGTSGYLSAFYLAKQYPEKQINWIFPVDNNPIGVGEGTVPEVTNFLTSIGITSEDILTHCNGSLKLGIKFEGFSEPGKTWLFPFGANGEGELYNSTLTARVMETAKIPDNLLQYPDIALHIRNTELLAYMDTLADKIPNLHIRRDTVTIDEIQGTYDLLIDSTGFKRTISYMPDNFVSLEDRLPNNSAVVYRKDYTDLDAQCLPYSTFMADDYGWIWHIPLGNQLALGYVHNDKYSEQVTADFIEYVNNKFNITVDPAKIEKLSMKTGRNKVHLKDNVVAIGLSSGFVEPLESTGLYLTVSSIKRICEYIDGIITEEEYNKHTNKEFDIIVDFIIAHYKYTKRDSEYWNFCKNIPIELFQEMDLFPKESWKFLLAGLNPEYEVPKWPMDGKELVKIHKGKIYHEWLSQFKKHD